MLQLKIREYFVDVEKELDGDKLLGMPIFSDAEERNQVGKVVWYNKKKGLAKIRLAEPVHHLVLIHIGISPSRLVWTD